MRGGWGGPGILIFLCFFGNHVCTENIQKCYETYDIREGLNGKKTFSFGHCANEGGRGGGPTHARSFWPLFKKCIFGKKKSLFLQKCQCIELLTVF